MALIRNIAGAERMGAMTVNDLFTSLQARAGIPSQGVDSSGTGGLPGTLPNVTPLQQNIVQTPEAPPVTNTVALAPAVSDTIPIVVLLATAGLLYFRRNKISPGGAGLIAGGGIAAAWLLSKNNQL